MDLEESGPLAGRLMEGEEGEVGLVVRHVAPLVPTATPTALGPASREKKHTQTMASWDIRWSHLVARGGPRWPSRLPAFSQGAKGDLKQQQALSSH